MSELLSSKFPDRAVINEYAQLNSGHLQFHLSRPYRHDTRKQHDTEWAALQNASCWFSGRPGDAPSSFNPTMMQLIKTSDYLCQRARQTKPEKDVNCLDMTAIIETLLQVLFQPLHSGVRVVTKVMET